MNTTVLMRAALWVTLLYSPISFGHGNADGSKESAVAHEAVHAVSFGKPGSPDHVDRRVHINMSDSMRFTPALVNVKRGETIRFIVHNEGKVMHEMVLAGEEELAKHARKMRMSPGMAHDAAHIVHVAPGRTREIVWQFSRAGNVQFGCLIPGHFEAGMVGTVEVAK